MLAAPLLLSALLGGLGPAEVSAATCQVKAIRQPISPQAFANNELNGVAVLSPCDVWAVGSVSNAGSNPGQVLVEHWDGSAWTVVPSASPGTSGGGLSSVRAVSAHDIWAVGFTSSGSPQALVERYTGSAWTQVPAPTPGSISELESVRPVSANDAWAVGDYNNASGPDQTLILRWDGVAWQQMRSPNPAFSDDLSGVAVTSSHDVWAVGHSGDRNDDNSSALILHWNGHRWLRPVMLRPGPDTQLLGVGATSPANAWAVGFYRKGSTSRPLLLHWNGSRWRRFAGPTGITGSLAGVYVISARNAWAAGALFGGKNGDKPLLLHWDGSRWTRVSRPAPGASSHLFAVAASSARNIWAVGSFRNPDGKGDQALGIHCC